MVWTRTTIVVLASLGLVGCALNSGVTPVGPDNFIVTRQAATGFSGSGTLKAEALNEASQYCAAHDKVVSVTEAIEAPPPYILGNFPKAAVQFMCLDATDPRLKAAPKLPGPYRSFY